MLVDGWEGTGGKPQSHAAQRLWVTYLEHLGCSSWCWSLTDPKVDLPEFDLKVLGSIHRHILEAQSWFAGAVRQRYRSCWQIVRAVGHWFFLWFTQSAPVANSFSGKSSSHRRIWHGSSIIFLKHIIPSLRRPRWGWWVSCCWVWDLPVECKGSWVICCWCCYWTSQCRCTARVRHCLGPKENRRMVMICDDLWWSVMICDDLWWSVMICDDLWWSVMICDDNCDHTFTFKNHHFAVSKPWSSMISVAAKVQSSGQLLAVQGIAKYTDVHWAGCRRPCLSTTTAWWMCDSAIWGQTGYQWIHISYLVTDGINNSYKRGLWIQCAYICIYIYAYPGPKIGIVLFVVLDFWSQVLTFQSFSFPTRCQAPTASLPSLPSGFLALCSAPLRQALWAAEWKNDGYFGAAGSWIFKSYLWIKANLSPRLPPPHGELGCIQFGNHFGNHM